MAPGLNGIDHVHLNVADRDAAEKWYRDVLNFKRVEKLMAWAVPEGPLTIEDAASLIHLALFERADGPAIKAIAFNTDGVGFLAWKTHLEQLGLKLRIADHELAYSLYFSDPWGNQHEITTYERDQVAERISKEA